MAEEITSTGPVDVDSNIYHKSFEGIPNKFCYHPGGRAEFDKEFKSLDENGEEYKPYVKGGFSGDFRPMWFKSRIEPMMKALNTQTGGPGTAGYALIPVFVDPRIVDTTRKFTPLVEILPRVTNFGITADYNVITSKGGATTAAEDAALTETTTAYDRKSTAIKYVYAIGRVTGQGMAAIPPYTIDGFQPSGAGLGGAGFSSSSFSNSLQSEILVKTREIREKEEDLILNGNATTSGSSNGVKGPNGTEYDGIITLMGVVNTVDKNTTALSLDDVNLSIRYAYDDGGRPSLAVCSSSVYNDLLGLLQAKIGFLQATAQVFWGFTTIVLHTMVGDVPVIPSMFMSNVSGAKAMYFLDLTVVEMRMLQDLTFEDLAKTADSRKFMLKMYEALIIKNTAFCSSITEIQ